MSIPPNTALTPVRPTRPLIWPASVTTLQAACDPEEDLYLVGGAVRDAFLRRPLHDIDLASPGDGRPIARTIANRLNGAYYTLDHERGVGRAIIDVEGTRLLVDVAQFRGPDLLTDLQNRDFTLNAMAVKFTGDLQAVFDPTGGLIDLDRHVLRRCSPDAIRSDPVRALRAVRASINFGLLIDPLTRDDIRRYANLLPHVSSERLRDEFFQMMSGPRPQAALDALQRLGLLDHIIPEARYLLGVTQSPPHTLDVWRHTLAAVERLHQLLAVITGPYDDNLTANIQLGTVVFVLGSLREKLQQHLVQQWPNERTHHALLLFAALMHDIGKPATRHIDEQGRIRYWQHEQVGAETAAERASWLRLSSEEIARIKTIVQHHMRPLSLTIGPQPPSSRAIYRFWRSTGPAGVDICLLSLADYLATYGITLDTHAWLSYLEFIRTMLESYFSRYAADIAPESLLNGQQLIEHFSLAPGPTIGHLLEQLREAQALGEITSTEEALNWVQCLLENSPNDE